MRLETLERTIERGRQKSGRLDAESRRLRRERAGLRQRLIDAARKVQDYEDTIAALNAGIGDLDRKARHAEGALGRRRNELGLVLFSLQRLARNPTETFFLVPGEPEDKLHGSVLLWAALNHIDASARTLRAELKMLANLKDELRQQRRRLEGVRANLKTERAGIKNLLVAKNRLYRRNARERERTERELERLASEASDLKDLLERLKAVERARAIRPRPPLPPGAPVEVLAASPPVRTLAPDMSRAPAPTDPVPAMIDTFTEGQEFDLERPVVVELKSAIGSAAPRPFSEARGTMPLPARGAITVRYDQTVARGRHAKGITIRTTSEAQVVSPYDGKVAFAGPFRGYGRLLIIEHGEGYHTVLAGLADIHAVAGQWLLAGEPVGVMGWSKSRPPHLYVELRQDGQPINPLPWLTANKQRVSG